MAASIGKFAPTGIMLAAVGYCCWPYLDDPGQRPKVEDAKKLPQLTASILSPDIKPAPGRDPFGIKAAEGELFKDLDPNRLKKADTGKKLSPEEEKLVKANAEQIAARKAAEAKETARKAAIQDLKAVVNSSKLNATYLRGAHRIAVINNELFQEGQRLENLSPRPVKVAQIHPHKVILELEGQQTELSYETSEPEPKEKPSEGVLPGLRSLFSSSVPAGKADSKPTADSPAADKTAAGEASTQAPRARVPAARVRTVRAVAQPVSVVQP